MDRVHTAVVDGDDLSTYDGTLENPDIGCLDQGDPTLAGTCLERGIDYGDISPSDRLLRETEEFGNTARKYDSLPF